MQRAQLGENAITQGVIWKQLMVFFFPILFGTFFQQLYNTADAMIVGQFVGKEALAAVGGTTSNLINLLVNMFVGISSGATVIVAQFVGAKNYDGVQNAVHSSIALALVAGAGMTVLGIVFAPLALRAMSVPPQIMGYAVTYIRIYFLGLCASCIYNIGSGILRAMGDTKRPLYFLIVSCMTNIVLDLLFVLVFHWGVAGAAIATTISQVVSALLILRTLHRPETIYHLSWRKVRFTPQVLKNILRVGFPAGLQSDMYSIANIILQSCINSFGTDTMAAWTAFGKIDGFFWMIMSAFGVSITTFVGQNFGAQKYERIRKSVRVCLAFSFVTAVLVGGVFCLGARGLLSLFSQDAAVIDLGIHIVLRMAPFYFVYIFVEIFSGAIRGTGNALIPMLMVSGGICVLRIAWVFLVLPFQRTFDTVILSYPVSWAFTSVLFIVYYLHGGWLKKRIQKMGYAPETKPQKAKAAKI